MKNFPKDTPEQAIIAFLETQGLPIGLKNVKFHKNKKNINIDVENIEPSLCHTLIRNLHDKVAFDAKIYCRGLSYVITPPKPAEKVSSEHQN